MRALAYDWHVRQGLSVLEVAQRLGVDRSALRVALRARLMRPMVAPGLLVAPAAIPPAPPPHPGESCRDGHRWLRADGYVTRTVQGHPVREHRWVMEQVLGRRLNRTEHVHHRNGVRHDNRPKNLAVLTASAHHVLENTLHDRWARNWDTCRSCATVERPHHAQGYCLLCYERVVRGYAPRAQRRNRHFDWSDGFPACRRCGTTQVKHAAHGLCRRCYEHAKGRRDRRPLFYPLPIPEEIRRRGLLTTDDVASHKGVTPTAVKAAARAGRLPGMRVASHWAFVPRDVQHWAPRRHPIA